VKAGAGKPMKKSAVLLGLVSVLPLSILSIEADFPKSVEDVLIVDCLLPGQVRKLGRISRFMAQRRPARLSQFDCGLRGGEYVDSDRATLQTSLTVWLAAATGGDAAAMVIVGEAFAKGLGAAPDYAQAMHWFKRSADIGNRRAMQNLGHLFELGLGTKPDRQSALDWYRQASGVAGERVVFASTLKTEQALSRELDSSAAKLAEANKLKTQAESALAKLVREMEALKQESATKRQEIIKLRAAAKSTPKRTEEQAIFLVLQEQIQTQERLVASKAREIRGLQRALLGGQGPTALTAARDVQMGSLQLTIIEPPLLSSRGAPSAQVVSPPSLLVSGRIAPRDRLARLWVGAQLVDVDESGLFHATVQVDEIQNVQISTLEASGARGIFEFTAIAQPGNSNLQVALREYQSTSSLSRPWPKTLPKARRWLLVIANRDYQNYEDLGSPLNDAEALAKVLVKRYQFTARILRDATRLDMLLALEEMSRQAGAKDDVVIFYAGHGELGLSGSGAWIPVDGRRGASNTWIENQVVSDLMERSLARNVLIIADSCYAATLSGSSVPSVSDAFSASEWEAWARASGSGRSRMVLSSGGVRPVLDASTNQHSEFAGALLRVLGRSNGTLEAQRVYREVSDLLAARSLSQPLIDLPVYAPLRFAGHEQGELMFDAGG